jgi:hypothetical protein
MLENDHAIFLKYFPKNDLCFFSPIAQKGGHVVVAEGKKICANFRCA